MKPCKICGASMCHHIKHSDPQIKEEIDEAMKLKDKIMEELKMDTLSKITPKVIKKAIQESNEEQKKIMEEPRMNKIKEIEEKFNKFIKKWCPNYVHLIDSDENDGEKFRIELRKIQSQREELIEKIENERWEDRHTKEQSLEAIKKITINL